MNSWPGDWNCRSCNHLNFQRRDTCQRCGELRPGGGGGGDNLFASFGASGGRSGGGGGGGGFFSSGPDVRPGDWYCTVGNCGAHNFASRSSCFKCGSYKEDYSSSTGGGGGIGGGLFYDGVDVSSAYGSGRRSAGFGFGGSSTGGGGSSRSGWKSGDWICTRFGCNEHNFASRMECFKCSAPRDSSNTGPSYYT